MARNQVRIGVGVDDKATKPINGIRDAFARLQKDGAKGLQIGLGAAAGVAAFRMADLGVRALADGIGTSINAARDLNETLNKSKVVFGDAAVGIAKFGDTAARQVGLSKEAAVGAAATFGNLFVSLGTAPDKIAPMSQALVELAADLASFNNISVEDALAKLQSGIVGQARPLRELGVAISEAAVSTEAAVLGFKKVNGVFTEGEKVQARYSLIFKQTQTAQGDFARTSGDLANSQRTLDATMTDLAAVAGGPLIDALTILTKGAVDAAEAIAGFVGDAGDLIDRAAKLGQSVTEAGGRVVVLADAIDFVTGAWAAASGPGTNYMNNVKANAKAATDAASAADEAAAANYHFSGRLAGTAGESLKAADALKDLGGSTIKGSAYFRQFTSDAKETGAGLDNLGGRARATALGFDTAADSVAGLTDALIDLDAQQRLSAVQSTGPSLDVGGMPGQDAAFTRNQELFDQINRDKTAAIREAAAARRSKGGGGGKSLINQQADELRNTLKNAYDVARQAATRTFDEIHQRNLGGIQDARDHAYAVAQTTFNLKLQGLEARKAALYDRANADAASLSADQQQRQLRDLTESAADAQQALAEAMAGGDAQQIAQAQRRVRDAGESLSDFQRQMAISAERTAADAEAAKIDAEAKAARDELTAAQKAADDLAELQTAAENDRYAAEVEAFNRAFELLKGHLDDTQKLHSSFNDAILADYKKYLAKYKKAGANIGKALVAGLKSELSPNVSGDFTTLSKGSDSSTSDNVPGDSTGDSTATNVTINVYGAPGQDEGAIANEVMRRLKAEVNRSGVSLTPAGAF
jgi:hypothetical protein